MKNFIFISGLVLSFSSFACPHLFNGEYTVKVIDSDTYNKHVSFPNAERAGISRMSQDVNPLGLEANRTNLKDGLIIQLEQIGCEAIQITTPSDILPGITEMIKATSIKINIIPETNTYPYKKPESVEWKENSLTFSRSEKNGWGYRRYKTSVTKSENGSLEVVDIMETRQILAGKNVNRYTLVPNL